VASGSYAQMANCRQFVQSAGFCDPPSRVASWHFSLPTNYCRFGIFQRRLAVKVLVGFWHFSDQFGIEIRNLALSFKTGIIIL